MAVYALTWQLNSLQPHPEEQEAKIIEALSKYETHNHPDLKHVWFISTKETQERVHHRIYHVLEHPDRCIIFKLMTGNRAPWFGGELSKETNAWIEERITDTQYNTYL